MEKNRIFADSKRVFITHSGCSLEVVNAVQAELSKFFFTQNNDK